jgi:glutamate N-acetyltransferase/amino-acid N-acetyltransferase
VAVNYQGLPALLPVSGLRLGTTCAGIKKPGRRDLVVIAVAPETTTAAVFTRNAFCAAPVTLARTHLAERIPRYLLVNTGNANAGTGRQGLADAEACCDALARTADCHKAEVLPFSTGVIGEPLPVGTITAAIPQAFAALSEDGWEDAAHGILTTDTVPKGASRQVEIDGQRFTVTGMAKGSGMIRPDMATMLAFVATDAALDQPLLQRCLEEAVVDSFNRITVDGDTSTNDACVLMATGRAAATPITGEDDPRYGALRGAVLEVCQELARAIVRDGEGATKLITVDVVGGRDEAECEQVAYTIAHSPLVKTAFFAGDPNWGRILAAVGRAGVADLDLNAVTIHLADVCIVRDGGRSPDYVEEEAAAVMAQEEIVVRVALGRGASHARVWTCDLSYEYVRINAEYRT